MKEKIYWNGLSGIRKYLKISKKRQKIKYQKTSKKDKIKIEYPKISKKIKKWFINYELIKHPFQHF